MIPQTQPAPDERFNMGGMPVHQEARHLLYLRDEWLVAHQVGNFEIGQPGLAGT